MLQHLAILPHSDLLLFTQLVMDCMRKRGAGEYRRLLDDLRRRGWVEQIHIYRVSRHRGRWSAHRLVRHPPGKWPRMDRRILEPCHELPQGDGSALSCSFPPHTLAVYQREESTVSQGTLFTFHLAESKSLAPQLALIAVAPLLQKTLQHVYPIFDTLSPQDRDVVAALAEGADTKDVARRLGINESTVRSRIAQLMQRYGVQRRAALVAKLWHGRPHSLPEASAETGGDLPEKSPAGSSGSVREPERPFF